VIIQLNDISGGGGGRKRKRVSRKAKELINAKLLKMMIIITTLLVVVEEDWKLVLFVKIRIFDADFGLQIRIVGVDLLELIGKRSILRLDTTTIR